MHQLYSVKIAHEDGMKSHNARAKANDALEENGFAAQGMFTSGRADWYVVGGRWSGILGTDTEEQIDARDNRYDHEGAEDDAQFIDSPEAAARLLERLKALGYEVIECFDVEESEESDTDEILTNYTTPFWLVVIDYHN